VSLRRDSPLTDTSIADSTIGQRVVVIRSVDVSRCLRSQPRQLSGLRYVECCSAGERAGLYYTCINSFLTPDEVAYIINNSESKVLIFSQEKRAVATETLKQCPNITVALVADAAGDGTAILNLDEAVRGCPATPIQDESLGTAMLYSSGTTGRPKGILRPPPETPPAQPLPVVDFIVKLWRYREGMT
jgi:long-chain acyl-CoA synthetase